MKKTALTLIAIGTWISLIANQHAGTTSLTDYEKKALIDASVKYWQSLYGNVNFNDRWLFNQMTYIKPKLEQQYKSVSLSKLNTEIKAAHERLSREIFRGELQKQMVESDKAKIYLGVEINEEDLLYFAFDLKDFDVTLHEGSAAYLIELRQKKDSPKKEWAVEQLSQFLFQNINLPDSSAEALAQRLRIPEQLNEGQVFSTGMNKEPALIRGWSDLVTAFVGKNSINVILFKAQPGRAMLGLPHEAKWLSELMKVEE